MDRLQRLLNLACTTAIVGVATSVPLDLAAAGPTAGGPGRQDVLAQRQVIDSPGDTGAGGQPPPRAAGAPDFVTATDGVFEHGVQVSWSREETEAFLYRILRDGELLSVLSSEDSTYTDTTGLRGVVYLYCVVVENADGGVSVPVCDAGSRILFPPGSVSATDGQLTDGVRITWDDRSAVEAGYLLRRDGVTIDTLAVNARSAFDASAVANTSYTYEVVAFDADGSESAPRSDTGFRGVVLPPLDVSASDGQFVGAVVVTWTAQTPEQDRFIVSRTNLTTAATTVLDTTAVGVDSYADSTAEWQVGYSYCVAALDGLGRVSVPVCDAGGLRFPAPMSVQASDSTFDDRVRITWQDASDLEDGFWMMRDGISIDTLAADVESFDDRNAMPGVSHVYCVIAFNLGGGASGGCDAGSRARVLAPTNVAATDGTSEDTVEITWQSQSTTAILFKVFRNGTLIKTVGPGARAHADVGGTADAEYLYGVQAVTAQGVGSATGTDVGRRKLIPPTGVVASDAEFEDRVEITWTDNSAIESGSAIYRAPVGSAMPATLVGTSRANVATFVDRTGVPGVRYVYAVAAFDDDGLSRGESDRDDDEGRRVLTAPRGVEASDGRFEDHVEITWEDRSNVEDGYNVYRNAVLIGTTPDNTTSLIDANPVFGVHSEYSVRTFDAYGASAAVADSGFTTIQPPASLTASDVYASGVVLRWVDVSQIEAGYMIRTDSSGVTVRVDTTAANATTFVDAGAQLFVQYTYRLRAFAGAAVSDEIVDHGSSHVDESTTPTTMMEQKVQPSDGTTLDFYGTAIAASTDRLVAGSPGDGNVGSVYIFSRNDLSWTQTQKILHPEPQPDRFGEAIAMDGDALVIGMPNRQSDYRNTVGRSGIALVFQRQVDGFWNERSALRPRGENPPDFLPEDGNDRFGVAVAVSGNLAVVGAPGDDRGQAPREIGAVYFALQPSSPQNWHITDKHFATDAAAADSLGKAVAIHQGWAFVGAPGDDDRGSGSGSALIFKRVGTNPSNPQWVAHSKVTGDGTTSGARFGAAAAMSANAAFIGAPGGMPGTVHVFAFDAAADTWTQTQILSAGGDAPAADGFGMSIAVSGSRLVVGASEAAFVFVRDVAGTWNLAARFTANDPPATGVDRFGSAVAVNDEWMFVGANRNDIDTAPNTTVTDLGSVYTQLLLAGVTNVTASDGSFDDRVHIEWEDRSRSEDGVIVYRDGVEYERLGPNAYFYDDFDAEPGQTYEYQVAAINEFAGLEPERVPDFGWRPPDGHVTGRVTSQQGSGVAGVAVCLEPTGTGALLFDGVGGHVRIPDDGTFDFDLPDPFTIEAWFRDAGINASPRFVSKKPAVPDRRPFDLGLNGSGQAFFTMADGTNVVEALSQRVDLRDDRWHHIAAVHAAASGEVRLYVDGVLEATASTTGLGNIRNTGDALVGGFDVATWFGGQLDELRIWGAARSLPDIVTDQKRRLTGDEEQLLAYWSFDLTGAAITDIAGDPQYGRFVHGVYATSETAPLDVCDTSDTDGNFSLTGIRYEENGTSFRVRPALPRHEFSPAVQVVAMNSGHPVENQVNFTDVSAFTLSGRVQFAGSQCFESDVQFTIDGEQAGVSDKNGKFAMSTGEGRRSIRVARNDYTYFFVIGPDTTAADSVTLDVFDDVSDILVLNTAKHTVSGLAGGSCDRYVGDISIRFRSESSCLDTTFVGNPSYRLELPPLVYFASATVDPATIPAGLSRADVMTFFRNLGERELDLTAVADTTLDFVYRAPLQVVIEGFQDYVTCAQLFLENGTPLPANTPIVPQLETVPLTIRVQENYGTSVCPLDSGIVVVTDEIFDQEDRPDTLTVIDGVAEYATFASTPSLVAGRTEGANNRSFQKAITATAIVPGRAPVSETEWVLVTGRVAPPGAEFVTFTADVPIHILRDPPGDGSSAFIEESSKTCTTFETQTALTLEGGIELKTEFGFKPSTFVGAGIGAFAGTINAGGGSATLENKGIIGWTFTDVLKTEVCLTTTERFATSGSDALVGQAGDVFIGAGINFLFTRAGTVEVGPDCRVVRGSVVAFEPDSIATTYAFTESHIKSVLIPELDATATSLAGSRFAESYAAQAENWRDILEHNRELKAAAETTGNRSFSAGTEYSYRYQSDSTTTTSNSTKFYWSVENKLGTDFDVNLFGAKAKVAVSAIFNIKRESTGPSEDTSGGSDAESRSHGYTLLDGDLGDNFTVDIKKDGEFPSPVFQVRAGKSSCPYEPWPDLETGDPSMVARDRLALRVDPQQPDEIPTPGQPAVLRLTLENQSDETREYELRALSESNPGGAILRVNGNLLQNGVRFTIGPERAHEATLTVERGPRRFFYQDLQLALRPACGDDGVADVVHFNVAFQTECSGITLFSPESGWRYSAADDAASETIDMILTGYERLVSLVDSLRVQQVGVQYRHAGVDREGPAPWTDVLADSVGADETLIAWKPPVDLPDGVYELRAFTHCNTGGRVYSRAATGTIDRHAPVAFGAPEPADGQLSLGEDVRVRFNEPIACATATPGTVTLRYQDGPSAGSNIAVKTTCDGRSITLEPQVPDNVLEGRRLQATVTGVADVAGNVMDTAVTWTFEFRKSRFTWSQTQISRNVALGDPGRVTAQLANGTSQPVRFQITDVPAFLRIAPQEGSGRLVPGATRPIPFDIDPAIAGGVHRATVTAIATDTTGVDTTGVSLLDVYLDVACVAPSWVLDASGFEHSMSIIGRMVVDGSGIAIDDPADRLAAFVGSELRGVASPEPAGGSMLTFLTVHSNRAANEMLRFEVWDASECKRYPATLERIAFQADRVLGTANAPVVFTATGTLPGSTTAFALHAGWNWFSTHVASSDMRVVNLLSNLTPSAGDIIKSKTAFAAFDPSAADGWVGSLASVDNVSGYMIRLSAPGTILQEGTPVDPVTTAVPVVSGWNWIGYTPSASNGVGTALADLDAQGFLNGGEVIKGRSAFAQWGSEWLGNLTELRPGEGYRLYLQSGPLPGSFTYPAGAASLAVVAAANTRAGEPHVAGGETAHWSVDPSRYEHNMTVIAALPADERLGNDVLVGAFVGDACRGAAAPIRVAGIERDLVFLMIHSDQGSGETVTYRVFDAGYMVEYEVDGPLVFAADAALGTMSEPVGLSLGATRAVIPVAFRLAQNHPNPFNPRTSIRFELPVRSRVGLTIYNVRGQVVRRFSDTTYGPGIHTLIWDGTTNSGDQAPSGVYSYRITAGEFSDVKKMILLK